LLSASQSYLSQVAFDAGILEVLGRLINHHKQIVRKEVVWSLANVMADSSERVESCLSNGIVQSLILHMQQDVNLVRGECVWALTNALYKANSDSVKGIIDMGYFTASNYALELPDARLVFVALEGINHALNAGL
jgi:hypothetical protein